MNLKSTHEKPMSVEQRIAARKPNHGPRDETPNEAIDRLAELRPGPVHLHTPERGPLRPVLHVRGFAPVPFVPTLPAAEDRGQRYSGFDPLPIEKPIELTLDDLSPADAQLFREARDRLNAADHGLDAIAPVLRHDEGEFEGVDDLAPAAGFVNAIALSFAFVLGVIVDHVAVSWLIPALHHWLR